VKRHRYRPAPVLVRALAAFSLGRITVEPGNVVSVSAARAVRLRLEHLAIPVTSDEEDAA
jgi:hypothetical protein